LNTVATPSATVFNEAGPHVTPKEWAGFLRQLDDLVEGAAALVLSGSLPPGLPASAYAEVLTRYADRPLLTAVDTSGDALVAALAVGPDLVKTNHEEALTVLGAEGADPVTASAALHRRGAKTAAVSMGPEGLVVTTTTGSYHVTSPKVEVANPTGAGDTLMAALVHTTLAGASLERRLITAVSLAATTVEADTAGDIDIDRAGSLAARLSVTTCPR
jgi:tagatose 6-phosphate kinase